MDQPTSIMINNQWIKTSSIISIKNPFNGNVIEDVHRATEKEMDDAIHSAVTAFQKTRKLATYQRAELLRNISANIRKHADSLAKTIMLESGKPIRDAHVEVERAAITFHLAAGEVERLHGEMLPLDIHPKAGQRIGLVKRFPIGPIAAITPFNFPMNLVAHKLAPAIAAGCSVVLKPSSATPLTALKLGSVLLESNMPAGMINIVPSPINVTEKIIVDSRIKMLTFTGSAEVGWKIKNQAGKKRISLELGGNAAAIIEPDTDIDHAVSRCITGGYAYAGQICISLQRIYVHQSIYREFLSRFVAGVKSLKTGDPASEDTRVSSMIDLKSAEQAEQRIQAAVAEGAIIEAGGTREDSLLHPTVLTAVPTDSDLNQEEIFAPVTIVYPYETFDKALDEVNNSRFGLQAGVFTNKWNNIYKAFETLDVGGVVINDVPTIRVDNYPYGGIKESGLGREGVRYALEEMTELKVLVLPTT